MPSRLALSYTRKASSDLENITDYLQEQSGESIALRLLDAVDHTASLLQITPHIGIGCDFGSRRFPHMRRIVVSGPFHRWIIFYTPSATEIRIDRILHSAQNIPRLFR